MKLTKEWPQKGTEDAKSREALIEGKGLPFLTLFFFCVF
jgi:hypothetical protein